MRKNFILFILFYLFTLNSFSQMIKFPDKVYGQLFTDVQMNRIFPDSKTFADCIPKRDPKAILKDYLSVINNPAIRFSLKLFIEQNFIIPSYKDDMPAAKENESIAAYINRMLEANEQHPAKMKSGGSLLPLPNNYIGSASYPDDVYYWKAYFTMLGLQQSGHNDLVEDMVNNFAYLISQYGHVPESNRTYMLDRSQPPFFSLMVDLLAETKGNMVYALYQNALQKEYDFWMDKPSPGKHVVKLPDGSICNRYYAREAKPRSEAFYEDSTLAESFAGNKQLLYRNLRSADESGWEFSSRWLADGKSLQTIETVNFVPVDLNCLLYHLELTLAKAYRETGNLLQQNYYNKVAAKRSETINKYCFNKTDHWYYDYNIAKNAPFTEKTLSAVACLFLNVANESDAKEIAAVLEELFLKPGGLVTTLKMSGQKWDAPYGWAPLQYMAIKGLENYGNTDLAKEIAQRWTTLNLKWFNTTGRLMEKYDVENIQTDTGKENKPGDFGWTMGVLLKLMNDYKIKE